MKVFYYVFRIVELVLINVILIKILINVFSSDFIFKTISQFLKIQYIFNYPFLFIFDNDNFKKRVLLIKQ